LAKGFSLRNFQKRGCSPGPIAAFRNFAKSGFEILRTLAGQLGYMTIGNITYVMNLGVIWE